MLAAIPLSHHHHHAASGLSTLDLILICMFGGMYVFTALAWGIFRKAGWHGWEALIPGWNLYGFCRAIRGTGWFLVLLAIPFLNLIAWPVLIYDLMRSFGKKRAWFWGLLLLPIVFIPILGFGRSEYLGPAGDPSARDAFGKITRR